MTASYLSPAELGDIWSAVKSTPCYHDFNGIHRIWADLLAEVAARNSAGIVALGARLMETSSSLERDERTYIVAAMSTAYVRLGQLPQARELLMTQWDKLNHGGEFGLSLRELLALAQPGEHPALAGSRPTEPGVHGS